jgi:ribonuclease-3
LGLPQYTIVNRTGPDHAPTFTIRVMVKDFGVADGAGSSRRNAEQEAAAELLAQLEKTQ